MSEQTYEVQFPFARQGVPQAPGDQVQVSANQATFYLPDARIAEPVATGSVLGRVWLDDNADGIHDAGEGPYLGGGQVVITDAAGGVHTVAISPTDGTYAADGLAVGNATVTVDPASLPATHVISTQGLPHLVAVTAGGLSQAPATHVKPAPES